MGTLLRHGSDAQKREYLPKIASGDLRLQAFAVTEPTTGTDTTQLKTTAGAEGRPLHRQRPEGLDLASRALRPDAAHRTHDTPRGGQEEDGRVVGVPRRPPDRGGERRDDPAPPGDDEPRDDRGVLRQPGGPGREPGGRGGARLPLPDRRAERRAHSDRGRMRRRAAAGSSSARSRTRTSASSSTGRSARTRACSSRSPAPTSTWRRRT